MLRGRIILRTNLRSVGAFLRYLSTAHQAPKHNNFEEYDFLMEETRSPKDIVKDYLSQQELDEYVKKEGMRLPQEHSKFRNEDGTFIKGNTSAEARLDDRTLLGKLDHSIARLPDSIAKVIENNILKLSIPARLRHTVMEVYQAMSKDQIQKTPIAPLHCNAHIAAFFLQDYSHASQVLSELQRRVGKDKFNPQRVLDIGYGPATGMVALNEIMGDNWVPKEKDSYIVGRKNDEMKKRAKLILSRQLNENYSGKEEVAEVEEVKGEELSKEEEEETASATEENDYIGPVDVRRLNIRTKLRNTLPMTKTYDLIIIHSSLLSKEFNFPKDVDDNLHMVLKLLAPGGHIVLIERGNAVGFETIARARQVMIRPEAHRHEMGKIPRPYIKGSKGKPQRSQREPKYTDDQHIMFEEELDLQEAMEKARAEGEEFEKELNEKYGDVTEEELKFEDEEEMELFEADTPVEDLVNKVDYHLSVIAPCAHHRRCPLQMGDPKYYKISNHKHRMNFCSFSKVTKRPDYTMQLKKGTKLAVPWDRSADDGIGKITRGQRKQLSGSGRPGGNDTESGSYSYLIVQRSLNDAETIKKIEELRSFSDNVVDHSQQTNWPRILSTPQKLKKNVRMTVCSAEGNIETWQVPKSMGKQVYHDARKSAWGDLWPLGAKTKTVKNRLSNEAKEELDFLYKTTKKTFLKEQQRKVWKKKVGTSAHQFDDGFLATEIMASQLEASKKYRSQGRKAKFDVDPSQFDGN
ncbi:37S ribosomal protein S22, mitochondrial [Candida viswanathii]|uniref:37S ribosomal protein S22, mitochondrial n=1 Tax=Candida viswanathii TaxID=5486 RepID=A0A367Y4U2_9ASCO|nr:37S ribosomal protein S22, mitochondrial [Candida viswanathii]